MFLPAAHADFHIPVLRQFLADNPLGILTTAIPSTLHSLLQSSHIPWVLDVLDPSSATELPILRGHLARQNPQAQAIIEDLDRSPQPWPLTDAASQRLELEVLVLFNGPVHHYVTPKFYTETKPLTGKVVPTWNYSAVQAYGKATVYIDSKADSTLAFLTKQLDDLSYMSETAIMGYEKPWKVADAPEPYLAMLRKNIIGIEIEVTRLEGRFKMSQEMNKGDRVGVAAGFAALGTEDGAMLAEQVKAKGEERDALSLAKLVVS